MKIKSFYLKLVMVVAAGFVFTGCIKNPGQAGSDIELMQIDNAGNIVTTSDSKTSGSIVSETTKFKTPIAEGVITTQADLFLIREGLAENFDLKIDEVRATIEGDSTANYATGYVNVGQGEKGGIYFAAKKGSEWVIVYDGLDTLTCDMIEEYSFPAGMIPRCYDMETGMMLDR